MATHTSIIGGKNGKFVKKDVSKLVAVPNISLRARHLHADPPSSTSPIATSSNSTAHTRSPLSVVSATRSAANPLRALQSPVNRSTKAISTDNTEQVKWEYDVYAKPFVPTALRSINTEKETRIISSRPKHRIDYQAYTFTFAGLSFIPDRPANLYLESQQANPLEMVLTVESYLKYFDALMKIEHMAKKQEHETYALYRVPLRLISTPEGDIWALSVPGLREDSPFVEMGDTLQVRQLWVDSAGNPVQMATPMAGHQIGYSGHSSVAYELWTKVQHDASVYSVNRAQETVYLKAEGLGFLYIGRVAVPMIVNVVFPLKKGVLRSQQRALISINSRLRPIMYPKALYDFTSEKNDLHNLEETKIKYASTRAIGKQENVGQNDWTRRILFPTESDGQLQTRLRSIPHRDLFDHAINYEQAHAVNDVCGNDYGTLPYLISGPPGTGKTKTLVEITLQLLNTTKVAHIIICAPSEAAADTLALRLKDYLDPTQLFRLNRPGRADIEVPRELMQYCYIENDMFHLPPFKKFMSFNVVVTSCRDAAILIEAHLTNDDLWSIERNMMSAFHPEDQLRTSFLHWGALLIDEAAQATEIDVLPAISVVYPPLDYPCQLPQPRFVMAGDENQLGPRTASRDTRFSTSLFARLFDRPLFKDHPLSRSNIKPSTGPPVLKKAMLPIIYPPFTLLIRNYRSHPAILSVPSSLFYNDTLIPEVHTPSTPLQHSSLWRGRKWPVLFIPHVGLDEIERDGGGWYNAPEARLACSIAEQLVLESQVQQSDICIMSPFAAQVKVLRALIRSNMFGHGKGLWAVNIGPLEAFQGLESRIVIICTTRTRDRFLEMDEQRGFGIVHQKRKMNVALTRAKEALFVIGSPKVLAKDEHWRNWMGFCSRNGLVSDGSNVWNSANRELGNEKVGVLERALLAKEQGQKSNRRALGAGAASHDLGGEYEAWVESLRKTLDEEDNAEEDYGDEVDHDEDEDVQTEGEDGHIAGAVRD